MAGRPPPAPGPRLVATQSATGVDANRNGGRDDLERRIALEVAPRSARLRALLLQEARAHQRILEGVRSRAAVEAACLACGRVQAIELRHHRADMATLGRLFFKVYDTPERRERTPLTFSNRPAGPEVVVMQKIRVVCPPAERAALEALLQSLQAAGGYAWPGLERFDVSFWPEGAALIDNASAALAAELARRGYRVLLQQWTAVGPAGEIPPGSPEQEAIGALAELVALKDLKDAAGKTENYRQRQPRAWEAARGVLARERRGL